jgi:peptide/nickel transport system permease protein
VTTAEQREVPRREPNRGAPLLEVEGLTLRIPHVYGSTEVVSNVGFTIAEGETVGLVGESGCGKTLTGLAIMGLLPREVEAAGSVRWRGRELLDLSAARRRELMGREIAMVYQDALLSLNPGMPVHAQVKQLLRREGAGRRTVTELLELVHLTDPDAIARAYPFQLSGGQRQRVLIAMALARRPQLLVADEPTTALDETVQAQIVDLLRSLQHDLAFSTVMITHNIALVGQFCERTLVMYAGQLVEEGPTAELIAAPKHPYTHGLVESIVSLERRARPATSVEGVVPSPHRFVPGCRFVDRCANAGPGCLETPPPLEAAGVGRRLACYYPVRDPRLL